MRSARLAETLVATLLPQGESHRRAALQDARRRDRPRGAQGQAARFIEVQRRKTREDAEWTLPTRQRRRIVRAAQYWLAGYPEYAGHDIAFDVVLTAPFSWSRYIANAFPV
jgi:hypothetical protein